MPGRPWRRGASRAPRTAAPPSFQHNRAVLLAVDVGNTQTHFGAFQGEELVEHWRFATVRDSTADELGAALRNLVELRGLGLDDLDASIISSTVPQLSPEWVAMAARYLGHEMLMV